MINLSHVHTLQGKTIAPLFRDPLALQDTHVHLWSHHECFNSYTLFGLNITNDFFNIKCMCFDHVFSDFFLSDRNKNVITSNFPLTPAIKRIPKIVKIVYVYSHSSLLFYYITNNWMMNSRKHNR